MIDRRRPRRVVLTLLAPGPGVLAGPWGPGGRLAFELEPGDRAGKRRLTLRAGAVSVGVCTLAPRGRVWVGGWVQGLRVEPLATPAPGGATHALMVERRLDRELQQRGESAASEE